MPDGSSSAAPVITPGPSDFHSNRIHRVGENVGTNESERKPPTNHSAIPVIILQGAPHKMSAKVIHCDQTSVFASSIMLGSKEVRGSLYEPVLAFLRVRWKHGNPIDRSFGGVFTRWRGLGLLSLARLARSQNERLATLLDPTLWRL
jgi:hypothetical protein